jgi:4,5-DOPA dioxygenase extradiol
MAANRMPVGFIGHGNPLNLVMEERYAPWRSWAERLPRPKAILAISAHWEDTPVLIGQVQDHQHLMYDFGGFPEFMYQVKYPAPGAPDLADRVEELLSPHVGVGRSDRAIDHGVWVPLTHLFPAADVPLLQISMPSTMSEQDLLALGTELAPLRNEGVLIIGTGNVVHNLRRMSWEDAAPPDYVVDFDRWVERVITAKDTQGLTSWNEAAPDPLRNHPSAEHFRPLIVVTGAAAGSDPRFPVRGFEHATIGRRSVQFD